MLATVFASGCRLCEGPLDSHSSLPVCSECLRAAFLTQDHLLCTTCGEALPPDSAAAASARLRPDVPALCDVCATEDRAFTRAAAHGDYAGSLRDLIHLLKFEGVYPAAAPLGEMAATAADLQLQDCDRDVVLTSVPLHFGRRKRRGFNQAEAIASHAARGLKRRGWRVDERHGLLSRRRETRSQFELNPRQRRANLRGAFVCTPSAAAIVANREVLLIDDILTTGITAQLCAKQLLAAGATKVWVATAARSQPPMFATFQQQEPYTWGSE